MYIDCQEAYWNLYWNLLCRQRNRPVSRGIKLMATTISSEPRLVSSHMLKAPIRKKPSTFHKKTGIARPGQYALAKIIFYI
jgi:hypothetical protein